MWISSFILGKHPNNTCFSFNWHNVRHIQNFLKRRSERLPAGALTIADIGGGASPYYPYFADKAGEYIAIDYSEALPRNELRPIRQIQGQAENIPLPDGSTDVALCNQVLEHVNDPQMALSEIFRILKPGGIFLGSVPHVSPVHLEPNDFRRYTLLGIQKALRDSGFSAIEAEGNGGVFSCAALMIAMDLLLSRRQDGRPQHFSGRAALLASPMVCLMNLGALAADKIFGDSGRTPANLCWSAHKPT